MIKALEDADKEVRFKAITALGMLGSAAQKARPMLLGIVERKGEMADEALHALSRIDPELDLPEEELETDGQQPDKMAE